MRSKSTIVFFIVLILGASLFAGNLQKVHPLYRNPATLSILQGKALPSIQ